MYPINRMNDRGTGVQVRSRGAMTVVEREGVLGTNITRSMLSQIFLAETRRNAMLGMGFDVKS